MKDIDEIRRENIRLLEREVGSPQGAADRVGMSYAQYVNLRDGAKDSKTGKQRGMRKETAWKFEDACGKPRGWLDQPHTSARVEAIPVRQPGIPSLLSQLRGKIQSRPHAIREGVTLLISRYLMAQGTKDCDEIARAIENMLTSPESRLSARKRKAA